MTGPRPIRTDALPGHAGRSAAPRSRTHTAVPRRTPPDAPPAAMLSAWLRDARAMELGLIPILQVYSEDARSEPALRERIESRIALARRRADLIASCLSSLEPAAQPCRPEPPPAGDQALKAAITLLAAEHYEAACFRAMAAAGHPPTTRLCEDLLREQHDHTRWLLEHLPDLAARCLARP